MVELKLHIRTLPDGTVVLDLGVGFRIVFGLLATILSMGIIGSETMSVFSLVALVLLVVGALYQEQWTVDPNSREVVSRHGLLIMARTRRWSFDEIESVEYTHYRVGTVPGSDQPGPPGSSEGEDPARLSREAMASVGLGRGGRVGQVFQRHFLRYSLVTTEGVRIRMEMRRVRDWTADITIPRSVAQALGVALTETPL
jgi:hypothetical protein